MKPEYQNLFALAQEINLNINDFFHKKIFLWVCSYYLMFLMLLEYSTFSIMKSQNSKKFTSQKLKTNSGLHQSYASLFSDQMPQMDGKY